jgi:hypothetical protein
MTEQEYMDTGSLYILRAVKTLLVEVEPLTPDEATQLRSAHVAVRALMDSISKRVKVRESKRSKAREPK